MISVDLNADLGEGAADEQVIVGLVTSANIACGGHAGDPVTMELAVKRATAAGLTIGAHPGHEHRESFGRAEIAVTPSAVHTLVDRQLARLESIAHKQNALVSYVKLHGDLYHQAGRDSSMANAVLDAIEARPAPLAVLGQADSELERAAQRRRVSFYREAFADRAYLASGILAPRTTPGAVLTDPQAAAAQALDLVLGGTVDCLDGGRAAVACDSLCLHGDGPHAAQFARAVSQALISAGVQLRPFVKDGF